MFGYRACDMGEIIILSKELAELLLRECPN